MPRFVALLRGVNVGAGRRVPMSDLRTLLLSLGFESVRTLLNSGNAVFAAAEGTPADHAGRIRSALASRLGLDVPVIAKSAPQWHAIEAENPFARLASDPARLLVAIAPDASALDELASVAPLVTAPDRFHLGHHAAYLWCPDGILASTAANALLTKREQRVTTRNAATVTRIAALLADPAA